MITKHDFQIPASGADIMVAKVSRSSSGFGGTDYRMLNKCRCLTNISVVMMTRTLLKLNGTSTLNAEITKVTRSSSTFDGTSILHSNQIV